MIGKGSLVCVRDSSPSHAGTFWYVTGVIGGKRGGPTAYMLARHPQSSWRLILDANEVREAVNVSNAVGF
jgi:hypothetical protein